MVWTHELDQPQATVPGETVEMPVHPELRNIHTAPQPVKEILVRLNEHVTQEFNQLKKQYNITHLYNNTRAIIKTGTQFANT